MCSIRRLYTNTHTHAPVTNGRRNTRLYCRHNFHSTVTPQEGGLAARRGQWGRRKATIVSSRVCLYNLRAHVYNYSRWAIHNQSWICTLLYSSQISFCTVLFPAIFLALLWPSIDRYNPRGSARRALWFIVQNHVLVLPFCSRCANMMIYEFIC